jgi:hypothetical protein
VVQVLGDASGAVLRRDNPGAKGWHAGADHEGTMFWIDQASELTRSYATADGCVMFPGTVIARCGDQRYFYAELLGAGIEPDENGWITVSRPASEVFANESLLSFANAPLTLGHVGEGEAEERAVGRVLRPHREGEHLVADLHVCDRQAITLIRDQGWRAISAGYECGYRALGRGRGEQYSISADHVAVLGPDQEARCGDVCTIRDQAYGRTTMRTRDQMQSVLGATEMGSATEGEVGPVVVARLPGPASSYAIYEDNGRAVVVQHGRISRALNPGTTQDRRLINDHVAAQQRANARFAAAARAAWAK